LAVGGAEHELRLAPPRLNELRELDGDHLQTVGQEVGGHGQARPILRLQSALHVHLAHGSGGAQKGRFATGQQLGADRLVGQGEIPVRRARQAEVIIVQAAHIHLGRALEPLGAHQVEHTALAGQGL